jgi:hypothetical protein
MSFGNPVVGQEELIRDAIRSTNYVQGVSGWRIARDGSAEFNTGTFRSDLQVTDPDGSYVLVSTLGSHAGITIRPPDDADQEWNPAQIYASLSDFSGGGPGNLSPSLFLQGPSQNNADTPDPAVVSQVPTIELLGPTKYFDDSAILISAKNLILNNNEVPSTTSATQTTLNGTLYAGSQFWGSVTIVPVAVTPTSIAVTGLNVSAMTGEYIGLATPFTSVPGDTTTPTNSVRMFSVSGVSGTGITVWIFRGNTTATIVYYGVIGQ